MLYINIVADDCDDEESMVRTFDATIRIVICVVTFLLLISTPLFHH